MALIAVVLNILAAIIASNFIKRPFERVAALQEQAEESSRAKSSFLAHMSHEIRTPLNAVVGLSDLVLSEDKLQTGTADKLEKIHDSGLTILSIINDILDISKIESGKFEIVESKYDTPSLINDIVILNIVRIDEKPIEFKLIVDENIPGMLFGDELRVKQIFNNLLSNAFKYTDSGVVEWHTTFEVDGDYVWLISSVKDTGIGIKPADMAQLFTDYYQVEKSSDRKLQGTGLGLAIAKRLVDAMHGTISVESEFGRGSTFSLRLRQGYIPSMPIGKAITNSLSSIQYARLKYKSQTRLIRDDFSYARVLIVDDITTNIDVAKGMMKPYKMMIDSATSGPQAIEMIRSASPKYNAVFMDHMMPGMDGIEAVRIIREEIGTDYAKSVPIIALTANAIAGNEKMFLENGFQAFVAKPIDITRLDVILRQWVRNKDLEQELGMSVFEAMKPIAFVDEEDGESLAAPVVFSKVGTGKGDTNVCSSASGSSTFTTVDLDISGINIEKALKRFDGDEAVLVDVLRSYAENTPELLADMKNYLAKNDLTDFSIVAHGIKGSSYGICADGVGVAAEELEKASKAKDLDTISARFNTFEESVLALLKDIDSTLVLVDESIIKPLAPTPDPELLQELRAACKAYDINRVNAAMSRLEAFSYEDGNKLIRWLRERVRDMDFEEILAMDFSEISIVSKTGEIS